MASNVQHVEGFGRIISGKEQNEPGWGDRRFDFRGQTEAWTTELWFDIGHKKQDLTWETAKCVDETTTVFSFVGKSPFLPYEYALGNQAEVLVNGDYALKFHLGIRRYQRWEEGDFVLEFIPKRVQTPFDGFQREFELPGCCGIYNLTVPERMITGGKPVTISVSLLPQVVDCKNWFMLFDRKDTIDINSAKVSEELFVMQQDDIRFKGLVNALARKCYPELFPERVKSENVVVLSRGHSVEMGWVGVPDILQLKNGDLLVSLRAASEHLSNDGKICTVRSSDSGKTWKNFQVVVSDEAVDHRDASVVQLESGKLIMHWFPDLSYDKKSGERVRGGGLFNYNSQSGNRVHVIQSNDNGFTWDRESEIILDPAPLNCLHSVEPCIELPSKRILMPVYGEIGQSGNKKYSTAIFKSDDEGDSWQYLSTVGTDDDLNGEGHFSIGEISIRMTDSHKIVAIMRTELLPGEESPVEGLHMWQSSSDDLGETWSRPKRLDNMLSRIQPNIIKLRDGRLLTGYGYRGIDEGQWGDQPYGIRFHVSSDEGETWGPQIILRDDFPNTCEGYPASVELEDNKIFTVYWFNLFGRYYLEGSYWEVPEEEK